MKKLHLLRKTDGMGGYVMILSLIFLVVLLVFTAALFSQTTNFLNFSAKSYLAVQATVTADAGIDLALWKLNNPDYSNYAGETNTPLGSGKSTFTITVKDTGQFNQKEITATGYVPNAASPKAKRSIKILTQLQASTEQIGFSYAIHAGSSIGLSGSPTINGNAYSNGLITGDSGTITGDAYYGSSIMSPPISVQGSKIPCSPSCKPIPDINHAQYQAIADAATPLGCTGGTSYTLVINTSMTIGPKKYDCNLEIAGLANVVVKVAGPVHVTGTFRMTGSATLQADPSLGTNGTMFIVDRWTYLSQNSKVMPTTTNDPANTGYLLFIQPAPYMYGSNNGSFCNCTFDIYSQDARAIFYTKYGSIRLSAYAHVTALTAGTINFSPGSSIIFDSGLPLETFTSGGLAWQFTKGSYHAVTPAEDKNLLAVYDETLQVPACATAGGISCDSGTLLNGRDNVTPEMVEQHASNTLPIAGFRCPDDIGGSSYRIDKLRVETVDGQPFAPGKSVIIKVDFYLVDTAQEAYIDFFYSKKTNNVQGADMQNKGSVGYAPYDGDIGGFTATSAPFTLNSGGDAKHFVRVNMHVTGGHPNPHSYCSQRDGGPATSGFDERDDLVFNVGS